jgi:hypothetical protein
VFRAPRAREAARPTGCNIFMPQIAISGTVESDEAHGQLIERLTCPWARVGRSARQRPTA